MCTWECISVRENTAPYKHTKVSIVAKAKDNIQGIIVKQLDHIKECRSTCTSSLVKLPSTVCSWPDLK